MTNELTLREKVLAVLDGCFSGDGGPWSSGEALGAIAAMLENEGSPAHMRVADELRGE